MRLCPIDEDNFIGSLSSSKGFIGTAGYSATSEALYLGKKILLVPLNHFEQKINAQVLCSMGIKKIKRIGLGFETHIRDWEKNFEPIKRDYPDVTNDIVEKMFEFEKQPKKTRKLPKLRNYRKIIPLIRKLR